MESKRSNTQRAKGGRSKSDLGERREIKVYGIHACRAIWELRREDIIRCYLTKDVGVHNADLMRWCASTKRAYHVVKSEELVKVTKSEHHEGLCLLVREARVWNDTDLVRAAKSFTESTALVYLDGVDNPHNVGAIARVAAHFGVRGLLVPKSSTCSFSGSTCRVAEGGAEALPLIKIATPVETFAQLKAAGFRVYATHARGPAQLYSSTLARKALFLFGAEDRGLSQAIHALADSTICIPGSGRVESLNVACASSVVLGEWHRQSASPKS